MYSKLAAFLQPDKRSNCFVLLGAAFGPPALGLLGAAFGPPAPRAAHKKFGH